MQFVTYTLVPSELTATPKGSVPTLTVALTVSVAVSITETLLLSKFVIYANGDAPATPANIKIESVAIPKVYIMLHSLFALLDLAIDESGSEKVEIGVLDIILLFIFFPCQCLSNDSDMIQHYNVINKQVLLCYNSLWYVLLY